MTLATSGSHGSGAIPRRVTSSAKASGSSRSSSTKTAPGSARKTLPLVLEVAPSGEEHRHALAVRGVDHHLIAHRATGLDDRRDAGTRRHLDAVGEPEVRV